MILEKVKAKYGVDHPRYKHIMGVRKLAIKLAKKHGVDPKKAEIAALAHDFYRHEDLSVLRAMVDKKTAKKYEKHPIILHAYAAAGALESVFEIHDEEIYLAVKNHVHGRMYMTKLEEIIILADFAEENRSNPGSIQVQKILDTDYDKALYLSFALPYDFLSKNRGVVFDKEQIDVRNYYHYKWIKNNVFARLSDENIEKINSILEKIEDIEKKCIFILRRIPFVENEMKEYFLLEDFLLEKIRKDGNTESIKNILKFEKELEE